MTTSFTAVKRRSPNAPAGKQRPFWVEVQLVDEANVAVAGIPWTLESHHTHDGQIDEFTHTGVSDSSGLIRVDMPHGLPLRLKLAAQPLADEMAKRALRPGRDAKADSIVRQPAEDAGYMWHYAVIGELCDDYPNIEKRDGEPFPPPFHFPAETALKGIDIQTHDLEKRHVIEICPFRAWELVLHHQKDYSIANAINLGGSACLAYADNNAKDIKSIPQFFINQCQDLSASPVFYKGNYKNNSLVHDVPFSQRYHVPVFMDTSSASEPEGDTRLFYVYNQQSVIVSWRGTSSGTDGFTDVTFRPINSETCDTKMQCTNLLPAGKVHEGFWEAYNLLKKKFPKEIDAFNVLMGDLNLFIAGHSLGGALALIHATELKTHNPLLYTYGMPRTFTRDAVLQLASITHFRHVNDTDPVPGVPPEANVDNAFYDLWGPVGTTLGGLWSTVELSAYQAIKWGDCYWHHGNPVIFLTATQSRMYRECKRILPEPSGCITIKNALPIKAKLYLVPELMLSDVQEAGVKQKTFIEKLTREDVDKLIPPGGNPDRGMAVNPVNHFMTSYMPYINNKLLELIDAANLSGDKHFTEHQENIEKFKTQMDREKDEIPEDELQRNEIFLTLESMLYLSLTATKTMANGPAALERFCIKAEEIIE
ncbi:lipase family protein [Klebsiella aerogenes]|uniref:lipase family protein n=1 Tax=Klebsiella aerogenes TaxID=548 RepID=UPI002FF9A257